MNCHFFGDERRFRRVLKESGIFFLRHRSMRLWCSVGRIYIYSRILSSDAHISEIVFICVQSASLLQEKILKPFNMAFIVGK